MTSTVSPLGREVLDTPSGAPPEVARATLADIVVANTLFGGRGAAAFGLRALLDAAPVAGPLTLLDIGAGSGDIGAHLVRAAGRRGVTLTPIALDFHREAIQRCRVAGQAAVIADAGAVPFPRGGVDVVLVSQLLHHFSRGAQVALLKEMHALARVGVIIADLERRALAAGGFWMAAHLLRFHRATRHDGVLSVRRGFTPAELGAALHASGVSARVVRRPGFRLVAAWRTDHADA